MNNLKLHLLTLLLLFVSLGAVQAQKSKIAKADKMFNSLNYQGALEEYLEILEKRDITEAKINIAECYRKIGNNAEAEYWYGQVVRLPEAEPIHKLYYGMALQGNGKCDQAKEWFKEYTRLAPDDLRGMHMAKACDVKDELEREGSIEIRTLPFNTSYDDFSPTFFKDGVVFASERDKGWISSNTHTWTGNPFLELFFIPAKLENKDNYEYSYGTEDKFSTKLNSKFHDAALVFNSDETAVYLTRNNLIDGKVGKDDENVVRLKIYAAEAQGDSWINLQGLPFNSDEYSVAHPAISMDEKQLYFSSDMPGGFGGMDLYVSDFENGRWSPPRNLGPAINTEGHEVFPYVHTSGRLYFASDGHVGLGLLDIYYMENNNGVWGAVTNVGYPINTIADDFGLILNEEGNFGYFASDREGGNGGDDIYSFLKTSVDVELIVYDSKTKEPLANATVINDCTGEPMVTDENGKIITEMPFEKCCTFSASYDNYEGNDQKACSKDAVGGKLFVELPLKVIENLEFELAGVVYDKASNQPLAGVNLLLSNDCEEGDITLTTDASGAYSFKLSQECCYSLRAEKATYLADVADGNCTNGLVQSKVFQRNLYLERFVEPIETAANGNPNTPGSNGFNNGGSNNGGASGYDPYANPASGSYNTGQVLYTDDAGTNYVAKNFLLHIYYDFDQSYIRDDAETEMFRILEILNQNPSISVEISSHTDARGSSTYNMSLSSRRADSVTRWLKDRGISSARLVSSGYGEKHPVNACKDFVPCSEEQHQRNRRTEFRVIGYGDQGEMSSKSPETVKVDPCNGCPF